MFMWCLSLMPILVFEFGSQTTTSASAPGAMMPFFGYMPNIRAGVVQHVSTQRSSAELAGDDALVDELHAVLDAADAVRDRGEVAEPELLLVLDAERAVVGGDDRQLVHAQALPQVGLVAVAVRPIQSGSWSFERTGVEHTHLAPSKPGWPSVSSSVS